MQLKGSSTNISLYITFFHTILMRNTLNHTKFAKKICFVLCHKANKTLMTLKLKKIFFMSLILGWNVAQRCSFRFHQVQIHQLFFSHPHTHTHTLTWDPRAPLLWSHSCCGSICEQTHKMFWITHTERCSTYSIHLSLFSI